MATVGTLIFEMSANVARLQQDMASAQATVKSATNSIQSAIRTTTAAFSALGVGLGIGALASYAKGLVDAAAQMDRMSERTGIGVARLSELKYAAEQSDTDIGFFATGMGFFEKQMVAGANSSSVAGKMFKALGVDITQGPNVALTQFAEHASAIDDAAVKTAAFRLAFGKAGDELISMMAHLKDTTDEAKRLGVAMDPGTTAAAKRLEDSLKALKSQSAALTMQWMGDDVSALATMTADIEKAAESGNKWLQVLKEIAKLGAATGASLKGTGGVTGAYGAMWDKLATMMFAEKPQTLWEQMQAKGNAVAPAAAPSSTDLASILSLQKAGAGRGARGGVSDAEKERQRLLAVGEKGEVESLIARQKAWQEELKAANDYKNSVLDATAKQNAELDQQAQRWKDIIDPLAPYLRQLDEVDNLYAKNRFTTEQWAASVENIHQHMDQLTTATNHTSDALKQADNFGKQMGMTFSSAFENALSSGKNLREVLKGIGHDIAAIITRETITNPMGAGISSMISGAMGSGGFAGLFGGLFNIGSSATQSPAPVSDMSFLPHLDSGGFVAESGAAVIHAGESVIPAGGTGAGGQPVVVQMTFNSLDPRTHAQLMATPQMQRVVRGIIEQGYAANGTVSGMAYR